jgi:hypothetical protein
MRVDPATDAGASALRSSMSSGFRGVHSLNIASSFIEYHVGEGCNSLHPSLDELSQKMRQSPTCTLVPNLVTPYFVLLLDLLPCQDDMTGLPGVSSTSTVRRGSVLELGPNRPTMLKLVLKPV